MRRKKELQQKASEIEYAYISIYFTEKLNCLIEIKT